MRSASVYLFNRRFDDCIAEFELALRLNPNFSPARGLYGVALSYRGRWEEGDARRARRPCGSRPRDPFAAIYYGVAAYCQYVGRNYEEAIRLSREALRQRSDFVGAHRVLTAALGMAGQDEAGEGGAAGAAPGPAQHLAGLARKRNAVRARGGSGALSGGVSESGVGVGFCQKHNCYRRTSCVRQPGTYAVISALNKRPWLGTRKCNNSCATTKS